MCLLLAISFTVFFIRKESLIWCAIVVRRGMDGLMSLYFSLILRAPGAFNPYTIRLSDGISKTACTCWGNRVKEFFTRINGNVNARTVKRDRRFFTAPS